MLLLPSMNEGSLIHSTTLKDGIMTENDQNPSRKSGKKEKSAVDKNFCYGVTRSATTTTMRVLPAAEKPTDGLLRREV